MLHVNNITKRFNHEPVLRGVSLKVNQGDIVCLLGSSGCGKTTLLRIITGLETEDAGSITLNGENIMQTPVHQRGFGLMFQDFALFPHMNAAENVAFGLQMQKLSPQEIQTRVTESLELVGLAGFAERAVTELSGGEQQRVGLARSLAPQPRLLMLDEPLGSLDAALRERLMVELREIIKAAGLTAIYVTHDQEEALTIADVVAVMNAGRIEQFSPPEQLYLCPQTVFVANFLGLRNILPVQHIKPDSGEFIVQTALGEFRLMQSAEQILLHPAYMHLDETGANTFALHVEKRIFQGSTYQLLLRHNESISLTMEVPSVGESVPNIGDKVKVQIASDGIIPLR